MPAKILNQLSGLDALVVFVDDSKKIVGKLTDKDVLREIDRPLKSDFKGQLKENFTVYSDSKITKRIVLLGTGNRGRLGGHQWRALGACAIQILRGLGLSKNIGVLLPAGKEATLAAEALTQGSLLSQLRFHVFKKETSESVSFDLVCESKSDLKSAEAASLRGEKIASGVNWARSIILLPGGHLNPDGLAAKAEEILKTSASKAKMRGEFWTTKELHKHKFGGVLGVGQGSKNPPRFIVLEYWGAKKSEAPIVLVGKGITFDSGGLSLKPPQSMETMKYDMAGAATVLATFKIISELKCPVNLIALVPSAENMPSGEAIRPGDVLTMASGKTVEVLNTDAEGRLILADALFYASTQYKPRAIVDVATLTGACAMAVGEAAAGLFVNSKKLENGLLESSKDVNENLWPLPNFDDFYSPLLKSDIADLKNIGGKEAGASTASIFLRHFVHNNTPWAHLDIAGCGWYDSPRDFIAQKGPSGVMIRTLVQFVEKFSTKKF